MMMRAVLSRAARPSALALAASRASRPLSTTTMRTRARSTAGGGTATKNMTSGQLKRELRQLGHEPPADATREKLIEQLSELRGDGTQERI